jgi:hypothetical protein
MTLQYVDELVSTYPSIREVWLFGSRANGTEREDSDWDYLVFGDDDRLLNTLCQDVRFKQPGIDLLFAGTADLASSPWTEPDGYRKTIGLGKASGGMDWREVTPAEAFYREPADRKSEGPLKIETTFQTARAALQYRRPALA